MDAFNIICGIITIASAAFAVWTYGRSQRGRHVEKERTAALTRRLRDISQVSLAITSQVSMIGVLADREATTKKELKHLAIQALSTISVISKSVADELRLRNKWRFGIPDSYLELSGQQHGSQEEGESASPVAQANMPSGADRSQPIPSATEVSERPSQAVIDQ